MIEKVIDNWLTKASEKSYQVPFAFMLIGEGHTLLHITRHCSMEYGKDIITIDSNGIPHAYQLKGAGGSRYSKSNYRDGLSQIWELVTLPVTHPSLKGDVPHRPFLVINGDIDEEVLHAIESQNKNWTKQGLKPLKTLVKGEMFAMAMRIKEYLLPTELIDIRSMLEFYQDPGTGFLDKQKFSTLLATIIHRESSKKAELRRQVSAGALVCAIALENFYKNENHISLIDGWTIYASTILRLAEEDKLSLKDIDNELQLASHQIEDSLLDLYEEVKNDTQLLVGNRVLDTWVFKHRITIIYGLLSELGRRAANNANLNVDLNELDELLHRLQPDTAIWGDTAVPYLISQSFYQFSRSNDVSNGINYNLQTLQRVTKLLLTSNTFFFDSYASAEQSLLMLFDNRVPKDQYLEPAAYSLQPLFYMCIRDIARPILIHEWKNISKCKSLRFTPSSTANYFLWLNENGQNEAIYFPDKVSWKQLIQDINNIDETKVPNVFKQLPNWVPLFLMTYPHRFTTEICLFYQNRLLEKTNGQGTIEKEKRDPDTNI